MTEQALWQPEPQQLKNTQLTQFTDYVNQKHNLSIKDYSHLHKYSIDNRGAFWRDLLEFVRLFTTGMLMTISVIMAHMIEAQWFQGMTLNFAENLLRKNDDDIAIRFTDENSIASQYSYRQLHQQVACYQQKLKQCGIQKGDRVVGFMPNIPQTIIAMLAATSLGAVWSSTSPDFGINGVVDRFGQIEPKVMFCANAYYYNGKTHDCLDKVKHISEKIDSIEHIVVVNFAEQNNETLPQKASFLNDWLVDTDKSKKIEFTPVPFDHPLYILYSSGTTGKPKCIVHRTGGILLQHLKELQLHSNITTGKSLFYFTTCGWMMWNWLVSGLATGATVVLYDGSPFYPDGNRLFDLIDEHKISHFGTSAKWISAVEKAGLKPRESHNLSSLETIFSTGSPLLPENFDFVYRDIKQDVCLSSISGGTDICSCFALGNSNLPVYRGQLQCLGLGLAVKVLDEDKTAWLANPVSWLAIRLFLAK
jgi:Acyl-coenzyme A synthetases/AMP-(fatty) acid ligases